MGKLYNTIISYILDCLEEDAKRILQECVDEREYEHRTKNLYDSYGYGIYLNGRLKRKGYLSTSPQATEKKKWYGRVVKGRTEISKYLRSGYSPGNGIELITVAAMPYAEILEDGSGRLKRSYRVITMSFQKLTDISKMYNGKVKIIR